ncbi:MAG: hypothetical protein WDW38_006238 [Sanguina aurantia]
MHLLPLCVEYGFSLITQQAISCVRSSLHSLGPQPSGPHSFLAWLLLAEQNKLPDLQQSLLTALPDMPHTTFQQLITQEAELLRLEHCTLVKLLGMAATRLDTRPSTNDADAADKQDAAEDGGAAIDQSSTAANSAQEAATDTPPGSAARTSSSSSSSSSSSTSRVAGHRSAAAAEHAGTAQATPDAAGTADAATTAEHAHEIHPAGEDYNAGYDSSPADLWAESSRLVDDDPPAAPASAGLCLAGVPATADITSDTAHNTAPLLLLLLLLLLPMSQQTLQMKCSSPTPLCWVDWRKLGHHA